MAREHGIAKKVYKNKKEDKYNNDEKRICPCCGLQIGGELIPLNASLKEIYHLGSGFTTYFMFIKYAGVLLISIFLISGLFNLITNFHANDCPEEDPDSSTSSFCRQGVILKFAISNKRDHFDLLNTTLILNLSSVVAIIFFFHFLRYQFRKAETIVDSETVTPSDYTLELKGVDPSMTEEAIKNWLQGFGSAKNPVEVVKVNRAYNIKTYVRLIKEKEVLLKKKIKYDQTNVSTEQICTRIEEIERSLEDFKKQKPEPTHVVFAVFGHANDAEYVRYRFLKGFIRKRFDKIFSIFISRFDKLAGKVVVVKRAPEPTDILWENLGFTSLERLKKRLVSNLVMLILIAIGFSIVMMINWAQDRVKNGVGQGIYVQLLSLTSSVMIFFWDLLSAHVIKFLSNKEKNSTLTGFYKEAAGKLSRMQLINTGFIPLLAKIVIADNFSSSLSFKDRFSTINIYGKGGLIENMYFVFIVHAFLQPIVTLFDPSYIYKRWLQKKGADEDYCDKMTQRQAHHFFEGADMDMADKYATLIRTILLASFYAPAIPFALIFSLVGLLLTYWADKYVLLRRIALPKSLNNDLTNTMVEYLEWMAFMFSLGNLMFMYTLKDSQSDLVYDSTASIWNWITLGVSLFHIYFPMEWLNRILFPITKERTETDSYEQARFDFTTDYDIENPITRKTALREFLFQAKGMIEMGSNNVRRFTSIKEGAFTKLTAEELFRLMNVQGGEDDNDLLFLEKYARDLDDDNHLHR